MNELKVLEFQKLEINEQIERFGKMFNLKLYKKDFEEIKNFNLYTLLADETIMNNLKNEKIKKLLVSIKEIATIFAYTKLSAKEKLSNPTDVVEFLKSILKNTNENMIAIYLTGQNKVIDYEIISNGTNRKSNLYPSKVAKSALLKNACSVIVAHNHPSESLTPSQNDILATEAIKKALKSVEVLLLDHIIIGGDGFYSFKDNGLI